MKILLALALLVAPCLHAETPRPISDAERAALTVVAKFLHNGPTALYNEVAVDAPLRRLPEAKALEEISARTGPRNGATWTLQTTNVSNAVAFRIRFASGAEDGLLLRMVKRDGTWSIAEIVSPAEPPKKSLAPNRHMKLAQGTLVIAGLFLLLGTSFRPVRVVFLTLSVAGFGATAWFIFAMKPRMPFAELRDLVPLREALGRGEKGTIPLGITDDARTVATRWMRQGDVQLTQLDAGGSRDARTYYHQAMIAAADGERSAASKAFMTAWELEPLSREDVAGNAVFFNLGGHHLQSTLEPQFVSKRASTDPMPLPPAVRASLCGEYLRLEINGARLDIPNGAPLAPKEAKALTPTEWHRMRDEEAIRDAERLLADPQRKWPLARREAAAHALAKHNRWDDFLQLTTDVENLDPALIVDRVTALLRRDRLDDARAIASGPVIQQLIEQKSAPALLLILGDAMVTAGSFDVAARLYGAVEDRKFDAIKKARLRSLEARAKLAKEAMTLSTAHFDVRYDETVEPRTAQELAETLEKMYAVVDGKLPQSNFRRVAVNVLRADAFRRDIAGSDHILGLYDGEILLPYVMGSGMTPELVAVITHELTHAVVAAATTDNAPRWFQEGLAQHMEPQQEPMQTRAFMPLYTFDPMMSNPGEPAAMRVGYDSARAFMRFLHERYPASIAALIRAFKQGKSTNEAMDAAIGKSADQVSAEFLQWADVPRPPTPQPKPQPVKQKVEIRWSRR